jgi:uncharacterized membrane protein YtjA (UPF0391 family)
VALIASLFGFVGTAAVALALAKGMFFVFPVLFFGVDLRWIAAASVTVYHSS